MSNTWHFILIKYRTVLRAWVALTHHSSLIPEKNESIFFFIKKRSASCFTCYLSVSERWLFTSGTLNSCNMLFEQTNILTEAVLCCWISVIKPDQRCLAVLLPFKNFSNVDLYPNFDVPVYSYSNAISIWRNELKMVWCLRKREWKGYGVCVHTYMCVVFLNNWVLYTFSSLKEVPLVVVGK